MPGTPTLTADTRIKLTNLGIIRQHPDDGFYQIVQIPIPFKTVFSELPFTNNQIPEFYEGRFYIQYLGFTAHQAFFIFNNYRFFNPTGLVNSFTLLIEAKNHIQRYSDSEPPGLQSRWQASEIGRASSGSFINCEKFGLTRDIIQDIDALLTKTKEDKKEMDRYLDSFRGAKKVEDLRVVDFVIEIIDRRFTKLITLERYARAFLEGLQ